MANCWRGKDVFGPQWRTWQERIRQDTLGPGGVKLRAPMKRDHVRGPQHRSSDRDDPPAALTLAVALVALVGSLLAGCASSERKATDRMLELNRAALADLKKGRPAEARKHLLEAERVGEEAGLTEGAVVARTQLALGSVYSAVAAGAQEGGRPHVPGAGRRPAVRLGSTLGTPAARRALAAAKAERAAASKAGRAPEPPPPDRSPARSDRPAPERRSASRRPARVRRRPGTAGRPRAAPGREAGREDEAGPGAGEARPTSGRRGRGDRPEERRPRADGEEPDLPANIPQDLYCPVPDQTPPDEPLTLRCVLRPGVRAGRLTLHYRPPGSETFTDVPMARSRKGWYRGVVPAAAATGKSLQYYVEGSAVPQADQRQLGQPEPGAWCARAPTPPPRPRWPSPAARRTSRPPSRTRTRWPEIEKERAREGVHVRAGAAAVGRAGAGQGLRLAGGRAAGVPAGPAGRGRDRWRAAWGSCCPRSATSGRERLALSLQLRAAVRAHRRARAIPPPGKPADAGHRRPGPRDLRLGDGNLRGFGSLAVGGGDGFRLTGRPQPRRRAGPQRHRPRRPAAGAAPAAASSTTSTPTSPGRRSCARWPGSRRRGVGRADVRDRSGVLAGRRDVHFSLRPTRVDTATTRSRQRPRLTNRSFALARGRETRTGSGHGVTVVARLRDVRPSPWWRRWRCRRRPAGSGR